MKLRPRSFFQVVLTAALCVIYSLPSHAQNGVAVFADRMLDVRSGEIIEDVVVYVDGEIISRIETLRPFGSFELPDGYSSTVLGDVTLLPGLIDCHTHLNGDLEGDWVHRAVVESSADSALRGARNAKITLHAGFTTVRDVGSAGFADVALMRAIDKGFVEGPRMFPAGHTIGITGGHADTTGYRPGIAERGPEQGIADGVDEVVKAVRYQIKHGAKVIKTCATAGVLSHEG
ncbi:MAG: imidazolonepropionase-like amidohydrolase, partial [Planctomycetota bacterium]